MKSQAILEVEDIFKRFKIYPTSLDRLKEWGTFGRIKYHDDLWALKGVSFKLDRGQALGVIGPNGAGKTTLLKIISNILEPTKGSLQVNGKVLSLFDISSGLDPQLNGRENVNKSSMLLGFPDEYIKDQIEPIKDFSGLGKFFELPVKSYSTGMRTRLAFSQFAFLECDLLILDEVLAVGDVFFRQKCYGRMNELITNGTSILFASHNFPAVSRFCEETITLHKGEVIFRGPSKDAIREFMNIRGNHPEELMDAPSFPRQINGNKNDRVPLQEAKEQADDDSLEVMECFSPIETKQIAFNELLICDHEGNAAQIFDQGEQVTIIAEFRTKIPLEVPVFGIEITDEFNLLVHSKNSIQYGIELPQFVEAGSIIQFRIELKLDLAPKYYILNLHLYSVPFEAYTNLSTLRDGEVSSSWEHVFRLKQAAQFRIGARNMDKNLQSHGGICDLPGTSKIQIIEKPLNER